MFKKSIALVFSAFFMLSSVASASVNEKKPEEGPIVIIGSGKFEAKAGTKNDALVLAKTAKGYFIDKKTCNLCEIQSLPRTELTSRVATTKIDQRLKETVSKKEDGKEVATRKPTYVTIRYGKSEHDYIGSFKITLTDYTSNKKAKILYFNSNTRTNQKGERAKFGKEYFFSVCVDYVGLGSSDGDTGIDNPNTL